MARRTGLTFGEVTKIVRAPPEVELSESYGTRALKVRGKLMARVWEDRATLVLRFPFVVRDHLTQTQPAKYHLTTHYQNYPYMLVRLSAVMAADLRPLLEESWRQVAPKRLLAARVATASTDSVGRRHR